MQWQHIQVKRKRVYQILYQNMNEIILPSIWWKYIKKQDNINQLLASVYL